MLKELSSVQAYLPFIHAMLADPDFCDPMLATPAQLRARGPGQAPLRHV